MFKNNIPHLENIIVFDIETIPDTSLASELCEGMIKEDNATISGNKSNENDKYTKLEIEKLSEKEKRVLMQRYHIEKHNGNSFLRQPFHKIVCVSFLVVHIEYDDNGGEKYTYKALKSYNTVENTEEEVVKKFWSLLKERKPRLVSFNGYDFDMNLLKCKALKYGIDCSWYFEYGGKWDGYESRYTNMANCDIEDENFGQYTLHEICIMLNIPCKLGIDGSKVADVFDEGEYKTICEYCETDVLATYLVYLRIALIKGYVTKEEYNKDIECIKKVLEDNSKDKQGLKEFLAAWLKLNNNDLLLK